MAKPSIAPPITHAQLNCAQQKIKQKQQKIMANKNTIIELSKTSTPFATGCRCLTN
tara:strand:+ start:228 stop:395 length:168 start_codon:yes stop_codon:yes gene_type:complete